METLAEFLKDKENQKVVLGKIIEGLRERGEWGRHGIFAKIAEPVGFSQSYVSKTLKGKMPLRENFVEKIAEYLGVSTSWLCGKLSGPEWAEQYLSYEDEVERARKFREGWNKGCAELDVIKEELRALVGKRVEYPELVNAFLRLPEERKAEALKTLQLLERYGVDLYRQLFNEEYD